MADLVFVYGTLKEGFPNFRVNRGFRMSGGFATSERFPLYLVSERRTPWLIDDPGRGEHVVGQVFQVDDAVLEQMDVLEGTSEPDGYRRRTITVAAIAGPGAAAFRAYAYLKEPRQLTGARIFMGPLSEYTLEHAGMYKPRA